MPTVESCGHCDYPMRLVAGIWCHIDRRAFAGLKHIAEPKRAVVA